MSDKLKLVKSLVAQSDTWTVADAMAYWWQNTDGGWRLTYQGFNAFKEYNLEHWDYEISSAIQAQPKMLLTLDRKLTKPYYIMIGKKPKLCFFDSKEATWFALYGDVKKFVDMLIKT